MRTGVATFTLDYGRCPPWLFERMVRLSRVVGLAVVQEFGPEEFLRRLSDPAWFQSVSCVIGMDWNASGTTTITLGALKEAFRGVEREVGIFMAGGKGKTSRKTPEQIRFWGQKLGFSAEKTFDLEYASRAAAKVDSALIQDGFELYHHSFLFNRQGVWTVVQQGMNEVISRARRYHWFGKDISDFVNEPHAGIASQKRLRQVLNLTAGASEKNRQLSLELIRSEKTLFRDLKILAAKPHRSADGTLRGGENPQQQLKILDLPAREFKHHPVESEFATKLRPELGQRIEFASPRLQKTVQKLILASPGTFESLMMTPGVGSRTIRALSLVSEIIYGAKPSYEDPARYSFALGGKDGTPFPVDRKTYDETLLVMEQALRKSSLGLREKDQALRRAFAAFGRPVPKLSFAEQLDQALDYL
jgi:hypothetical protein